MGYLKFWPLITDDLKEITKGRSTMKRNDLKERKMKFRVKVIMETDLFLDVEANTEEEAYEIAIGTDGSEYIEDGEGAWNITSVEKL